MEIPNGETLFRYAYPSAFPEDQTEIPVSVFQDPNLSCDWRRFQQAPERSPHMNEGRTVIVSIVVCDEIKRPQNPRGIPVPSCFQEVIHAPLTEQDEFGPNESHSLIRGRKKAVVISALRNNSSWTKTTRD